MISVGGRILSASSAEGKSASSHVDPLASRGPLLDQRQWGIGRQTMGLQALSDDLETPEPHVEHQGLPRSSQRRPIQFAPSIAQMAGDETHRLRMVAVGQGNAGIGSTPRGGGDAGHDLDHDTRADQASSSSPPRPKMKGSPPLSRTTR